MNPDPPEAKPPKKSRVDRAVLLAFTSQGSWLPSWLARVFLTITNLVVANANRGLHRHPFLLGATFTAWVTTLCALFDTIYLFQIAIWEQIVVAFFQAVVTLVFFIVTCFVGAWWRWVVWVDGYKELK